MTAEGHAVGMFGVFEGTGLEVDVGFDFCDVSLMYLVRVCFLPCDVFGVASEGVRCGFNADVFFVV